MTVYNAGSINGAESVAEISGVEIESIDEINQVKVEHVPLKTVIFLNIIVASPTTRDTDLESYGLAGWYVCNGEAGTPDYINTPQFLLGSDTYNLDSGYDVKQTLTHTHTTGNDGSHDDHDCSEAGDHKHQFTDARKFWKNLGGGGQDTGYYMHSLGAGVYGWDSVVHEHTSQQSSGAHSTHGTIGNSGTSSANNRPLYRTLIPIIRLVRLQFEFVVGCVLWYDANDIDNPSGRSADLSSENTDGDLDLPGWYVCNNQSGTLDMLNRFVRCEGTSGTGGGTNTALNKQHNHTLSSSGNHTHGHFWDSHRHHHAQNVWQEGSGYKPNWGGSSMGKYSFPLDTNGQHQHLLEAYTNTHDHSGYSNYTGSGDSDNKPAYYSMLLIERLT